MEEVLQEARPKLSVPYYKENPALKQVSRRYVFGNEVYDPIELANDLIDIIIEKRCLGIAANQCGLPYRVLAIFSEEPLVMFNPAIVDVSKETVLLDEGCLSFGKLLIKVRRPEIVKVRYADPTGKFFNKIFSGMTARVIQHEIDHLDGITFLERASVVQREKAKKFLRKQNLVDEKLDKE